MGTGALFVCCQSQSTAMPLSSSLALGAGMTPPTCRMQVLRIASTEVNRYGFDVTAVELLLLHSESSTRWRPPPPYVSTPYCLETLSHARVVTRA